jgi:DNA-binding NarL/FixJ family response regulator
MSMQDSKSIGVVAVDDHQLVLRGIASLFEAESDITLLGQASSGDEAIRLIQALNPDVAVVNMHMPDRSGLDVIAALRALATKTRFVILAAC